MAIPGFSLIQGMTRMMWSKTTSTVLSAWTTAVTILGAVGTGVGTLTIPAGALVVGSVIRIRARGVYGSTTTAPTLNWLLTLGGVTVCTSTALTMTTASLAARPWEMEIDLICVATGATATIRANGYVRGMNTIAVNNTWPMVQNTAVNVNTANANALDITLACGTSNAANTVTCAQATIELIQPAA